MCFCFWSYVKNLTVTWDTDRPDFTKCFQQTALIWAPCAFLWLFSFLEIFYIKNSINRNIPFGFLNISKLALTGLLVILSIVDLSIAIVNIDDPKVHPVDYYTPVIKIATFVSENWSSFGFLTFNCFCFCLFRHYQLCYWNSIGNSVCERPDCNFCFGSFYSFAEFLNWEGKLMSDTLVKQTEWRTAMMNFNLPVISFFILRRWQFGF